MPEFPLIYLERIDLLVADFRHSPKKLRVRLNLTQDDLARKSDVKYTTLSKIESGVVTKPTVHIMARIAKALNVSIENLIK